MAGSSAPCCVTTTGDTDDRFALTVTTGFQHQGSGMGQPAARLMDMHTCPMVTGLVPHVGGPIASPGCPTVRIGGQPAARVTDMATCVGPPDVIAQGSSSVKIGGLPAARIGDMTAHGGVITTGCPSVLIGDEGSGGGGAGSGFDLSDLLSSGMAMTSALTQARALVTAAVNGTPFCERCGSGQ